LVAARQKGEDTLVVVATMGDKAVVLKRSTEPKVVHEHNGAYWYHFEGGSFGFAPEAEVGASPGCVDGRDKASRHRLSWFVAWAFGARGYWPAPTLASTSAPIGKC
jgi:hypothetical protein